MNALEQKIEFYSRDIDTPHLVNGFRGTWQISEHALIPDVLHEYLMYTFRTARLKRVKIEDINKALNEVWEGPGSLAKVFTLTDEMRKSGRDFQLLPSPRKGKTEEEEDDDIGIDLPLSTFGIEDALEVEDED